MPFEFSAIMRAMSAAAMAACLAFASPALAADLMADFVAMSEQAQVLRGQASEASTRASAHPFAPPEGFALSGEFARRVTNFSELATALSARIEAEGGPKDLRCIYRGMAEDVRLSLVALHHAQNAAAQAAILKNMGALFADAVEITPQSPAALEDYHDGEAGQCPAALGQKIKSLGN